MNAKGDEKGNVIIRPLREEDIERIVALTGEVFEPASIDAMIEKMLGRPAATWKEIKGDMVREELVENPDDCFVAELNGKVVGYVTTVIDRKASRGTIPNLAVSAEMHRRGIGRKLLERALEHFRRLGLSQAKIETLTRNEVGQHLYPSLGFREVARQIHYVMSLDPDTSRTT